MSLDRLFQQIILTEQHVSENCRQLLEAKTTIVKIDEQIKTYREKMNCLVDILSQKGHFFSEMTLYCDLLKKQQEHLESRSDELQKQQQRLRDCQETKKKWEVEQQKLFMMEIKAYNCEYCLLTHRHTLFHHQAGAEMVKLIREADVLSKEMHFMAQTNVHMNLKQEKKAVLQSHLTQLEIENEELETEVEEAASQTSTLKVERTTINNKPHVDKLCLRLKDEVSMHKEENLDFKHQILSDKIQLLQKKLSQKAEKS